MGLAVVTVAAGGLPVVDVGTGKPGMPVTEATSGIAITKLTGKPGMPVTFVTATGGPVAPLWAPTDLGASLKAWYTFDALAGNDGDQVATLTDLSSNGFNVTQSTAALRATLAKNHQNNKNTLKFLAASNQRYALPNIYSGASAGSIYAVVRKSVDPSASVAASGLWSFGTSAQTCHWPFTDGTIYDDFGSTTRRIAGNPTASMAVYRIYSIYSALNDWALFIDGGTGGSSGGTSPFFSTATNAVGFDATPQLGISDDFTAALDGWIAEIVFATSKQSVSDRQKTEGYLAWKWGLQGNLDSAHPYKAAAP